MKLITVSSVVATASACALAIVSFTEVSARQVTAERAAGLPAGAGRAVIEAKCSSCHLPNRITASGGYTRQGWDALVSTMVTLSPSERSLVTDYLATNFPEQDRPRAVAVPGAVSVKFREWLVPSLGSRPHEAIAAADGSIWWTANWGNKLGRLDPRTGTMKEFPVVKTPRPGPHSLIEDMQGNIWYTANLNGRIGRFNPKTGDITEYPMPIITAWDPHTIVVDRAGTLWFTIQRSNMIGRLNPGTGAITLASPPTPSTLPYGIALDPSGTPWFAQFGTNQLASIDPNTMLVTEYALPNPDSRPRRIAVDAAGAIWYTDFARGYLGRFDPKSRDVDEWPSPGGAASGPFGITTVRNEVWYSESRVRPNTLVRFNPATQKFQTWAVPSGGDVPNMMATPEGNLVMSFQGVNRVALVEIERRQGE